VIETLDQHEAEWAIKVPFCPWLGLKSLVAQAPRWKKVQERSLTNSVAPLVRIFSTTAGSVRTR
jgi:hypothetical protein